MIAELRCTVLDCPDPPSLARFYQALLGGEVDRPDRRWTVGDDWATLHAPGGQVLAFQRVAGHRPPRWRDPARPAQFHLDFAVPDLDHTGRQVAAPGATLLSPGDAGRPWSVHADPSGHPFCLVLH
ncbi:VOC family protein [Streptomyces sp. NPDC002889]|uniref:VOC family protein n=1 Tax=Streptomyces sp. NPDC002889 TaxID=3364669 RepID=UPI0036C8F544